MYRPIPPRINARDATEEPRQIDGLHSRTPRDKHVVDSGRVDDLDVGRTVTRNAVAIGIGLLLVVISLAVVFPYTPEPTPEPVATPTLQPPTRDEAVVAAAEQWGVDPALALAVSYTENWSGDDSAWSRTHCCVGIMQVNVKVWFGVFHEQCGGSDLLDRATNACYGVLILRGYLRECDGELRCALTKYVGAVRNHGVAAQYIRDVEAALD